MQQEFHKRHDRCLKIHKKDKVSIFGKYVPRIVTWLCDPECVDEDFDATDMCCACGGGHTICIKMTLQYRYSLYY